MARKRTRTRSKKPRKLNISKALAYNTYPKDKYPAGIWYDRVAKSYYPRMTEKTYAAFGPSWQQADRAQQQARLLHGYRGTGDYSRMQKLQKWRGIGARLGNALSAGMKAYRTGGNRFTGFGDYNDGSSAHVTTYGDAVDNQLIAGGNPPLSVNSSNDLTGDIIFAHTEFIGNIEATTSSFENRVYSINPGLASTFPFLSQIARNFTLYEFSGLIFEFRPTSGEFGSSSNALGKVIMATDYDPDAQPFYNSTQMENYDYASSSKPSLTARHGVETATQQAALRMSYIRTANTSRDKIFTDIGTFQLATEGLPETGTIGELWVTYRVKLSRSQISQPIFPYSYAHFTAGPDTANYFSGGTAKANTIGVQISTDNKRLVFNKFQHAGKCFMFILQLYKAANDNTTGPSYAVVGLNNFLNGVCAATQNLNQPFFIQPTQVSAAGEWKNIRAVGITTTLTVPTDSTALEISFEPLCQLRVGIPSDLYIFEISPSDTLSS